GPDAGPPVLIADLFGVATIGLAVAGARLDVDRGPMRGVANSTGWGPGTLAARETPPESSRASNRAVTTMSCSVRTWMVAPNSRTSSVWTIWRPVPLSWGRGTRDSQRTVLPVTVRTPRDDDPTTTSTRPRSRSAASGTRTAITAVARIG